MATTSTDDRFEALLDYIKHNRGFDFTGYKRPTLRRRIDRRLQEVGSTSYDDYRDRLELQADEFAELFDTILINVTSFFRDEPTWAYIAEEIVPAVIENAAD